MENQSLQQVANLLHTARLSKSPITQLSKQGITLNRTEAYQVQEYGIQLREKSGERKIGLKMGLTSEGKRKQMNLDSPLYGELTDQMQIQNGGQITISPQQTQLIHSKIEPEIAFLLKADLHGEVTREQVLEATDSISACLEILDSRYDQFKYFSMEDVIADNSSSSHFVVGPWLKDFKNLDLKELSMAMSIDGKIVEAGLSKEISGDPVVSIIEQCRLLALRGKKLLAGQIVLAGAATAAVNLKAGSHVELRIDHLPAVHVFTV